jgi:hypothetical protein
MPSFRISAQILGSRADEENFAQLYSLGSSRIASPGIPAGQAGGRSFHRATPSLAACPFSSPSESVETVQARKIMNAQVSSRNGEARKAQPDAARTGRHARPVLPPHGERHQEPVQPTLRQFHPPCRAYRQRASRPSARPGGRRRVRRKRRAPADVHLRLAEAHLGTGG